MSDRCYRERMFIDDKKGRRFEVCCREGKVLLKREHWHQSIIENWIRLSFKNLVVTQFPHPSPWPSLPIPRPQKLLQNHSKKCQPKITKAQWQPHKTINNTFLSQKNLICHNKHWFLWHKFPSFLNGKAEIFKHYSPSMRCNKCMVNTKFVSQQSSFTRWILLMPF